jgi:hypothetical protein
MVAAIWHCPANYPAYSISRHPEDVRLRSDLIRQHAKYRHLRCSN